jgi:DeoR/GlpR family transcriptional regulator of sugar metabolism
MSRRSDGIAPHEKLGIDFFAKEFLIAELDLLITDEEADPEAIARIESKGVQVVVAKIGET